MANEVITLRDFSGGDEGRRRPIRGDVSTFRAVNAWTYPSGGIGPRPPFQYYPISGLPQQKLNTFNATKPAVVASLTSPPTPFSPQHYFFFGFTDRSIYRSFARDATATSVGTMDAMPVGSTVDGDNVYYIAESGAGATVDHDDVAITEIPDMPNGHYIGRWNSRLIAAISLPTGGAVAVSEPDDPTTWTDTIRVGSRSLILGLFIQRNTLVLPKFDGEIWVMRGTPTVNETLRQEDQSSVPPFAWRAPGAVVGGSNVWYCVGKEMVKFTGAQALLVNRPDIPAKTGYEVYPWSTNFGTVIPLDDDDEFLLVGTMDKTGSLNTKQVWVQAHRPAMDQWTRHLLPTDEFNVVLGAWTGAGSSAESSEAIRTAALDNGTAVVVTGSDTSGNGGRAPRCYVINTRQEHPHLQVNNITPPSIGSFTLNDGDTSAPVIADFRTAEYWDPKGRQLRVTDVVIDYSYNPNVTPLATYNKFDLTVEAMQDANSATVLASTSQTFTPTGSGSTPDGSPIVRGQQRFGVGDQGSGLGFRVRLADWRGIVVHGFTIYVQAEDGLR